MRTYSSSEGAETKLLSSHATRPCVQSSPGRVSSSLEELQICSNNYTGISCSEPFIHPRLKRVYLSKNRLAEWKSICHLGRLFPQLETLIASDNPLRSFRSDDDDDDMQHCLSHLHTLSVDQVQVSEWDDIIALSTLPRLHALRIYTAPLLKVRERERERSDV